MFSIITSIYGVLARFASMCSIVLLHFSQGFRRDLLLCIPLSCFYVFYCFATFLGSRKTIPGCVSSQKPGSHHTWLAAMIRTVRLVNIGNGQSRSPPPSRLIGAACSGSPCTRPVHSRFGFPKAKTHIDFVPYFKGNVWVGTDSNKTTTTYPGI